jgi:hypothetical protein
MTFNVLGTVFSLTSTQWCLTELSFGGNSHFSGNIFKIQKRKIIIITNKGKHDSSAKTVQILTVSSQYTFSLLVFVTKNRELFLSNADIHYIYTQYNYNLHPASTNLTLLQKGDIYCGSKVFNLQPKNIKIISQAF